MRRLVATAAFVLLSVVSSASAQLTTCKPTMQLSACWAALQASIDPPAKDAVKDKPTGSNVDDAKTSVAVRDYLPRLIAAIATPGVTNDRKSLGLTLNQYLNNGITTFAPFSVQFQTVVNEAKILQTIIDSVPQARRTAVKDSLQKVLDDLDDFTVSLSLNLETSRTGRNVSNYAGIIGDMLSISMASDGSTNLLIPLVIKAGLAIVAGRQADPKCINPNFLENYLDCYTGAFQSALEGGFRAYITGQVDVAKQLVPARTGFVALADLVNNQPQLNVTGTYRSRETFVGPNEWTVQFRGEWGFGNINGLRKFCSRTPRTVNIDCLRDYLQSPYVASAMKLAPRPWFTADLNIRQPYAFALPSDKVAIALPRKTAWTLAAGYGQHLSVDADGKQLDRVDIKFERGESREALTGITRVLFTANYTRVLSAETTLVFGFTAANKPEFLGEVTHPFRANMGFNYKLNQPSK